jgi:transmembrane sensor
MIREYSAEQFVARLYSGSMTERDEQALQQWLAESEQNTGEYRAALEAWDRAEALAGRLHTAHQPTRRRRPGIAMAAAILVVIAAGLMFGTRDFWPLLQGPQTPAIVSHTTGLGQQKTLQLADGSSLTLNTETRVLVDISADRRRVILDYGEAWFEVTPDPIRPFTVDTGYRAVTVLGTKFEVFKHGFELDVSVVEGVVVVHRPEDRITPKAPAVDLPAKTATVAGSRADQYRLTAGVSAQFSGILGTPYASVETRSIEGIGNYPYWRSGQLLIDNQPLSEAVSEINRYSAHKVLIEDQEIMDMPVSGVFRINEIDAALDSFEKALPVRVTRYSDRIVIKKL